MLDTQYHIETKLNNLSSGDTLFIEPDFNLSNCFQDIQCDSCKELTNKWLVNYLYIDVDGKNGTLSLYQIYESENCICYYEGSLLLRDYSKFILNKKRNERYFNFNIFN